MGWCLWMHSLIYTCIMGLSMWERWATYGMVFVNADSDLYMYHGLVNVGAVGDIWDGVCECRF